MKLTKEEILNKHLRGVYTHEGDMKSDMENKYEEIYAAMEEYLNQEQQEQGKVIKQKLNDWEDMRRQAIKNGDSATATLCMIALKDFKELQQPKEQGKELQERVRAIDILVKHLEKGEKCFETDPDYIDDYGVCKIICEAMEEYKNQDK